MQPQFPKGVAASIPLSRSFRFAHEPVLRGSGQPAFVGRGSELDVLAERLLFSHGGSFLITGYRGVGKTSFVNRVIDRMNEHLGWATRDLGEVMVIPVQLTLARAIKPVELMHLVVRRLYEELLECGLYHELPPDLRSQILLASQRTSMTMTRKQAETLERAYGISEGSVSGPLLHSLAKFNWGRKETHTRGEEFVFLAYDEKSAEHDLLRIARQLSRGYPAQETFSKRLRRWLRREPPTIRKLKFIFVFDEIDKIDDVENMTPEMPPTRHLDEMLASLKNVLTTSGICFLFVAGKDLHDRWLIDLGRGDSIYESVFCYDKYLACMWEDVAEIATRFVDRNNLGSVQSQTLTDFEEFLRYKGRGIPRRIIRAFNEYVRWDDGQPLLRFGKSDLRRFRFYSDLQRVLSGRDETLFGSLSDEASTERDRQRLGAYYFVDWILAHGAQPFTIEDGVAASRELSRKIAPAKEVAPDVIRHIVELLVADDILERVEDLPGQTMILDPRRESVPRYRLTRRRLTELGHFFSEIENVPIAPGRDELPEKLRMLGLIGQGGMGSVYRAWDEVEGRVVAVKMVDLARFSNDPALVDRMRGEGRILRSLRHPNIVRFLRSIDQGNRVYIVMDFIDGTTLRKVLRVRERLPLEIACWIGRVIVEAMQFVHDNGIVRLDLKPDNVLLRKDGSVYLADFGISKLLSAHSETETRSGVVIGTPLYMAPEQFLGVVTVSSDVYSFGVMLFEMITGRLPYDDELRRGHVRALMQHIGSAKRVRASDVVDVPKEIDELLASCLALDMDERPPLAIIRDVLETFSADVRQSMVEELIGGAVYAAERAESQEDRITASAAFTVPPASMPRAPAFAVPLAEDFSATGAVGPAAADVPTLAVARPAEPVREAEPPSMPILAVLRPPALAGRAFVLKSGKARIGRSAESDISLEDASVSRFHADIESVDGSYFITDLNSSNGVFVDGRRIRERTRFDEGSLIRIGSVEMLFEHSYEMVTVAAPQAMLHEV